MGVGAERIWRSEERNVRSRLQHFPSTITWIRYSRDGFRDSSLGHPARHLFPAPIHSVSSLPPDPLRQTNYPSRRFHSTGRSRASICRLRRPYQAAEQAEGAGRCRFGWLNDVVRRSGDSRNVDSRAWGRCSDPGYRRANDEIPKRS